jgi:hypothetical protein
MKNYIRIKVYTSLYISKISVICVIITKGGTAKLKSLEVVKIKRISSAWEDEELDDESIYSENSRANLVEDDEISAIEAAFMKGWEDAA